MKLEPAEAVTLAARIAAGSAPALFAASALCLTLLSALLDAGLLIEAPALELLTDPFTGHLSFESADRTPDVVVLDDNFKWAQIVAFSCHFVSLSES